jgi:Xaa-Pro aminopeptidase
MKDLKLRSTLKAIEITERALASTLSYIKIGAKEKDVAKALRGFIMSYGADGVSFLPIIASGKRSFLPHGRASEKRISRNDPLVFDFGVRYKGYCSDMTRSFVVGSPSAKQRRIFSVLLGAQKAALKKVRSGVQAREIDKGAREFIAKRGFGKYFIHSTGHGIGLKVHEAPRISGKNRNILKAGAIITVEPGIYIKGWGGMRIEDMVLVTKTGYKLLTGFPRRLDLP